MKSRIRAITVGAIVVLALGVAQSASADILISSGNTGSLDDENVLFPVTNVAGNPIFGQTQDTNTQVQFSSNENLIAPSGGQARVEGADGDFTQLAVTTPGGSYTSLILNLNAAQNTTGTVDFTAVDTDGDVFTFLNQAIGSGQNFFTFLAVNGQRIASVSLVADVPLEFLDARQVRIGFNDLDEDLPEPASLLLLGAALGGLALRRRRTRAA